MRQNSHCFRSHSLNHLSCLFLSSSGFGSLGSAARSDLVLDLQRGQALMVEHLANVALVEVEVGVAEVHEGHSADEEEHPRVVSLARRLKRIVTELVTVWQVVNVVLFLPSVPASVAREVVIVAVKRNLTRLEPTMVRVMHGLT